VYNIITDMEK